MAKQGVNQAKTTQTGCVSGGKKGSGKMKSVSSKVSIPKDTKKPD
tara:strand:- start:4728 stop:4862 length:135 start_codon:yes stop_codon:yes gene_type:complete